MRYILAMLIAAVTVSLSQTAYACDCKTLPPPKKALEQAAAVFMGKVTSIERARRGWTVTFEVEKSFKGLKTKKIEVQTPIDTGACGYHFTKGEVYIVYCSGGDKDKLLQTGLCTRTRPAAKAEADLDALGEGTAIE